MSKKYVILVFLAALIFYISGCGTSKTGTDSVINASFDKQDYKKITSANNQLGFQLLNRVKPNDKGNTLFSPTSLFIALSMVYNGAEETTKDEISQILHLENKRSTDLNRANASLLSSLMEQPEGIQLQIGNSIWLNDQFHFQEAFTDKNTDYFNAEIEEIDINNPDAAQKMNDWIKKSTNNKITEITDSPLDPNLVTMLINAIYFNGQWTYAFNEAQTTNRNFHLENGDTKQVPMMLLKEKLNYLENKYVQAVSLPYSEEKKMSMNIFLPKKNTSLSELKTKLTSDIWQQWQSQFQEEEGTVQLPKFQIEYETTLNDALQQLGMTEAFDKQNANFQKMIQENNQLWISDIKQKTYIEVTEQGTEAAGATSIGMETTSAPIDPPFHMEVNRPYFFTITDHETNSILFMGTIYNPS
ncbi:serpin family protein [Virgibacillus salexigens]|uniref:Serine protease inhibitor n=1 Tax=Virgibacillus kapii TaxID=1638645 RepID=A0ABQ2DUI6_9BACI|nr:serpin family protein [Virgibacillus kapii]GGJ73579.1 serine protease inhibitor [Virgibacillus kapii]